MLEKPLRPSKLKSRSNSTEKNYEIHPEISLAQIQNHGATTLHNKRNVKKRLLFTEKENGKMSSSVLTTSDVDDPSHRWETEDRYDAENSEPEMPSGMLELNTMFNFNPGNHCLIRKSSSPRNNGRQRRNSTIACSMANPVNVFAKKVEERGETVRSRRRLSIATMTGPTQKEERRQQKALYERLTMIESVSLEGKIVIHYLIEFL
jgi:hypothetical protein